MMIDKQEDIREFILTHMELKAVLLGNQNPIPTVLLSTLTVKDIVNISLIKYEEDSNYCEVFF